jgi:hypothetical protein
MKAEMIPIRAEPRRNILIVMLSCVIFFFVQLATVPFTINVSSARF